MAPSSASKRPGRRKSSAILDRYVVRETLGPLALGLLVFTFLLLIDRMFDLAAMIIQRHVPVAEVGQLLLFYLPFILVVTIPWSLLFALLIAIGRLSADSELVALRASGISLFSLYRPVLALSVVLAVATALSALYLQPWGNRALLDMELRILTRSVSKAVKPRVFFEDLGDKILYVFGTVPGSDQWDGVFYTESLPIGDFDVTVAKSGSIRIDQTTGLATLRLTDSLNYEVDFDEPRRSALRENATVEHQLTEELLAGRGEQRRPRRPRELDLAALRDWAEDPDKSDRDRATARVEIHKKFAIPAACLVFGLFGLPLGFSNQRGRSSGFTLSILVILVYYVLMTNGEGAAAQGRMAPWLAMWLPNLLFFALGLYLLWRRNRDKSLLLGNFDRWVRTQLWTRLRVRRRLRQWRKFRRQRLRIHRRQARALARGTATAVGESGDPRAATEVVLRLERPRMRFPNVLDRYLLRLFARIFTLVLVASTSIYVIASFTQLVDDVLQHEVPTSVVVDYYKYLLFQVFHRTAPLVVLLTTLISFGILARNNEVTAAKALGISLYRMASPILVAALAIAGVSAFVGSAVLPYSNARVAELRDQIKGRETVRSYKRANQHWLYSSEDGGYIYHYQYFDARRSALQRLHVFRFEPDTHALSGHLFASEARFYDGAWWVRGGWAKALEGVRAIITDLPGPQRVNLPEDPEFFSTEIKQPEQMSFGELRNYIAELEESGQDVPALEVELYSKAALPTVCVVMALVALPFAFYLGRRGALYGIGVALILAMAFYALIALFTTLGETGALPALVAVWTPNLLFGIFSLFLFLGVRT